jgi:hypothetical protein
VSKGVFDIIAGKYIPELPSKVLVKLGRYLIDDNPKESASQDGIPIEKRIPIIPDKDGKIEHDISEAKNHSKCSSPLLFQTGLGLSISEIAEQAGMAESWEDWTSIIPLVQELDKKLHLNDFEIHLEKWLSHLQSVVINPASKLERIQEKLPVSRVKRYRNRAIDHLAQHSEDWMKRKYQSVVPRRILAERIDESIDIYENQVTATLIDQVLQYLNGRIDEELSRLMSFMQLLNDLLQSHQNQTGKGWYPKVHRNFDLAGKAFQSNLAENQTKSRNSREILESCRDKLLSLRGATFFSEVSTGKSIGRTIKMTNRFESDQHYKYIAFLWEKWMNIKEDESDEEIRLRHLQLVEDYWDFVQLLLLRGLNLLHFRPVGAGLHISDPRWRFDHPLFGELFVEFDRINGRIRLEATGLRMEFIPIADTIELGEVEDLAGEVAPTTDPTFIVFMFEPLKKKAGLVPPITIGDQDRLGFIPISPEDFDGEERVARAIWYQLCKRHLSQFPVQILKAQRMFLERTWADGNNLLKKNINDKGGFWIEDEFPEHELKRLAQLATNWTGSQYMKPRQLELERTRMRGYVDDLRRLSAVAETRTVCISCGNLDQTTTWYLNADSFAVECEQCKIQFGRKGGSIFLKPMMDRLSEEGHAQISGDAFWLDMRFGKDVWSLG